MSVHKINLPNGGVKYDARWREGSRARSKRFNLKRDAIAWDHEVTRRRQLGPIAVTQLTVKGTTLSAWIVERWTPEHAVTLEPKTRVNYAEVYAKHIDPWLGHLPLQELSVGRLRQWQAERVGAGVGQPTIHKARTVLSSVLRHAAESEAITGNPIPLVRPPKAAQSDQVIPLAPLTVEGLRRRLGLRDAAIVSVLAYSGIRPGEMRALRWSDIGRTILIQRAATPAGAIKQTKTKKGIRNVRLLTPLKDDLAEYRAERPGRSVDLVFPGANGKVSTEDAWDDWRSRVWVPLWKNVDLDELGMTRRPVPYDLRHSFASLLLAEGRSVHYVAEQLGHQATLTLNRYGHLFAEFANRPPIDAVDEINKARDQIDATR